ncbi:N-acetylglutaminylglutamine amidotransferase [Actinomadura rugatobispora]|uniref:asparagine synthase (glutamine-hydrolyzing) n=1 Tax=Actinomadura rugatobispora TaxID=1994 RepID=A0ABW1A883_9ACTN|nr:N-acetylglutaminylglutamine amidotransferase [Actinomadura rugatobispora]
MCGLSGEVRLDAEAADVEAVARMTAVMEPRGPDGVGVWSSGRVALGHRRLKVIDLSDKAAQPMVDSGLGITGVFSGCLYNYRELRKALHAEGYHFFSTSDTEVLLKAYHRWGRDCVLRFKGMFTFALVERDSGVVVLGRDRLGIKPLYLTRDSERLRFASTLPALLAGGDVNTDLDLVALHHYMTFHSVVPAPRTILAGVEKLPPATVRTIRTDGRFDDYLYWRPDFSRRIPMNPEEWSEVVREGLRAAVDRRMVADVPVGVLLSGGLDSSFIVALLAESGQTGLSTYSIGFTAAEGEESDEFAYSDLVAERFGTDHHRIRVDDSRLLPALNGAIEAMSEPMVSHDVVAFYLLSREVSRHLKVVQSGQGADEVFGGYDWYSPLAGIPRADALPAYAHVFFDRPHGELSGILNPPYLLGHDAGSDFVRSHFSVPGAETTVDAALRIDTTVMLVDDPVKRVDNMTMAWGLEARTPFLDHELVELAAACPPELKLAQNGKGVLKDAARGIVPDEVIDRPKGDFAVPAIRHLSGAYLELVREALLAPSAKARGLFQPDYIARVLEAPGLYRTNRGASQLWQAALLELWLQCHGV